MELVIKRLKSLLHVDRLRARKDSQLAELYLHGKLLYASVLEKLSVKRFEGVRRKMDQARKLTDWRLWRTLNNEILSALKACFPAQPCFLEDAVRSLAERPRKRRLQTLPPDVLSLVAHCRELGMSHV